MKLSEKDLLLIEKYIGGTANDEESRLFHEKQITSKVFAEQAELQETMVAAIKQQEDSVFKKKLKVRAQQFQIPARKKLSGWIPRVAAALLLIIMLIFILPSSDSIFEDNFKPLLEQPITRGESAENSYYEDAMKTYSIGNYQQAYDEFDKISAPELIDEASLYKGNCLLALGDAKKAIGQFSKAKKSNNQWIAQNADWYMALALIKVHDKSKAIELLEFISKTDSPYKHRAKKLREKLDWRVF